MSDDRELCAMQFKLTETEGQCEGLKAGVVELRSRLKEVTERLEFCREWYSCRFERLSKFIREEIPEPQKTRYFSIIANGSADHTEPNTYAYQMNLLRHEKEAAEAELALMTEQMRGSLAASERVFQAKLAEIEQQNSARARLLELHLTNQNIPLEEYLAILKSACLPKPTTPTERSTT